VHHETSREKSGGDAAHQKKADEIMAKVLATLDRNGDGIVTKTEFVSAGRKGLPEFSDHEGLGHHYDSEGEYFLVRSLLPFPMPGSPGAARHELTHSSLSLSVCVCPRHAAPRGTLP
jgi:hypothetical protein